MATLLPAERVLSPRRTTLLATIQDQPGLGLNELARAAGLPTGSAVHHLGILERHGLVWHTRHGCRQRYFTGTKPAPEVAAALARRAGLDAAMATVLVHIQANPGSCQRDILDAFPLRPRSSTQHALNRLAREGFVHRRLAGRYVHYEVTP